jgi:phospholipid/cholesterol/gamma-HCH transport system substrate-binding protein
MEESMAGSPEGGLERGRLVFRVAAVVALLAAVAVVAIVLFGEGADRYSVGARFIDSAQLVKGNPVQIGGVSIGSVERIDVSEGGQAEVTFGIEDEHAPLRRGTRATIRQLSQSGIANRYIELTPGPQRGEPIPDGGTIGVDHTGTPVELDQLFNTLDPRTRRALQGFVKGSARQLRARGGQAREGLAYLNPALSTSSRLLSELTRDTPALERFLIDSSKLVTAVAERRDDLAELVGNLNSTTQALGSQSTALADSIDRLPPFMRRANTTFLNLRTALDELDPLVAASKPVARRLGPFLEQAREFAADARPTVRDLSVAIRRRGRANDLTELVRSQPRLAEIAMTRKRRTVAPGRRPVDLGVVSGAFPEVAEAAEAAVPTLAVARPYTLDFLGWLDDFSTTGPYDALGGLARPWLSFKEILHGPVKTGQFRRCPGGAEFLAPDRSNLFSSDEQRALNCTEAHRAPGP